jgi:hypothetical protein
MSVHYLQYYYGPHFLFIEIYTVLFHFMTDKFSVILPILDTMQLNVSHL